ncbi:hypothetical protein NEUTE2DRAFT_53792, partial [Neurospora tetrasperma FGSC 2509]
RHVAPSLLLTSTRFSGWWVRVIFAYPKLSIILTLFIFSYMIDREPQGNMSAFLCKCPVQAAQAGRDRILPRDVNQAVLYRPSCEARNRRSLLLNTRSRQFGC